MPVSDEQMRKWQDSLTTTFGFTASPFGDMPGQVALQAAAESAHREQIAQKGYGFQVLLLSYQEFAIRTLQEAPTHGNDVNAYNFAMNWAAFRRMRSAWNEYNNGYYEHAGSHLRSLLEITMYLACVLKGDFGFRRIHELDKGIDIDSLSFEDFMRVTRQHNHVLSSQIGNRVYGCSSGLTDDVRQQIKALLWTHHTHVHRSDSSVVREVLKMIQSKQLPPVAPTVDVDRASVFCNAAVLALWTHARVMPYLSVPSQFSNAWQEQSRVLDEAVRFYINNWEKPMREAFLSLIEASFTFDEDTTLQVLADAPV